MSKLMQGHNEMSFMNPYDYNRNIYIWFLQNSWIQGHVYQYYRSQLTNSKLFMTHGVPFSWKEIEQSLKRDTERATQRIDLTKNFVNLNNYTVMKLGYAKKCLSDITISEVNVHVISLLMVKIPLSNILLS